MTTISVGRALSSADRLNQSGRYFFDRLGGRTQPTHAFSSHQFLGGQQLPRRQFRPRTCCRAGVPGMRVQPFRRDGQADSLSR